MINTSLFFLVVLPIISGFLLFLFGKFDNYKKNISLFIFFLSLLFSVYLALKGDFSWSHQVFNNYIPVLGLDKLSRLILVFANLFGFLICLYSKDYMEAKKGYFSYLLWLLAFSNLEIMSMEFITFSLSWAVSIGILYGLLRLGSSFSAKKAAVVLGFSYICFIIGAYLYSTFIGSSNMFSSGKIIINSPICWLAFILMLIGALAKIGSGPLHTWIPTAAEKAPIPVMAILPASLDKLLGVYILSRICLDFFVLNEAIMALLLIIGGLTIIFAVMLALVQHDLRKLLAYHAISQAGYMVLGLGTGNIIGILGAIFHMFNNAIYKNGLFLIGGAVEKKRKTFELDKLGGLARYMPLTFLAGLILALSISGIPPLNGFASKWMIYQGTLQGLATTTNVFLRFIYCFALIAAMFGSALTLASFIKFIHAIFLGQDNSKDKLNTGESSFNMLSPLLILSGLCVILGVFSNSFVNKFIAPSFTFVFDYTGNWNSIVVSLTICLSLILGFILWYSMRQKKVREDVFFVGGESGYSAPSFPATEFYKTIPEMPLMTRFYRVISLEGLDIYNILVAIVTLKWLRKRKK